MAKILKNNPELFKVKKELYQAKGRVITLPQRMTFRDHGLYEFDHIFDIFDWSLSGIPVKIDFTRCKTVNYQALTLVILYCWRLKSEGCTISFELDDLDVGASAIWKKIGAQGLFHVSVNEKTNFNYVTSKPLIAIRNIDDFKKAVNEVEQYTSDFNVEYKNTLRHVISELLYNCQEHGPSIYNYKSQQLSTPSLIQFTWYKNNNELHFLVADVGVGIKKHLSQTYPGIESDADAINLAIKPQVSGTFGSSDPYESKDNAGVGLFLSTNIIRKLKADMYIISGNGKVHISPRDITTRTITSHWPGTCVLVSIKLDTGADFAFHSMMQEFRDAADKELSKGVDIDSEEKYYLSIENLCGKYAENKQEAIQVRSSHILPNLSKNKIILDFDNIETAPHSFLSALLATPVKRLGMKAYKKLVILNASPEIRETIDYILNENTE